jgi:hypothetical protein
LKWKQHLAGFLYVNQFLPVSAISFCADLLTTLYWFNSFSSHVFSRPAIYQQLLCLTICVWQGLYLLEKLKRLVITFKEI